MFLHRAIGFDRFTLPLNFHLVFYLPHWNAALLDIEKPNSLESHRTAAALAYTGMRTTCNFSLLLACYLNIRSSKVLRMCLSCTPHSHYKWYQDLWWHTEALLVVAAHQQDWTTVADRETELTHETHENFYPTWQYGRSNFCELWLAHEKLKIKVHAKFLALR